VGDTAIVAPPSAAAPDDGVDHLSTAHLLPNLRRRTITGGFVSASGQAGQFALSLTSNMVLARLLSPKDFGLVAVVMTVSSMFQIFRDAGLSTATIQRDDITHAQVSNLFWINLGVSAAVSLVMASSAPLIARFFHQPELLKLSLALSTAFVINGLSVQHMAVITRQMKFKTTTVIDLVANGGGATAGMVLAALGWGYWALVTVTLVSATIRAAAAWTASSWRPQLPQRGHDTQSLVRFGADLTLVGLCYSIARGSDSVLIGRFIGSEAVGLYSRATALLARPLEQIVTPIAAVVVPALSRLQKQPERYRAAFLQMFEGLTIFGCLFAGIFMPLAHPLTVVILGNKWASAAPIFAALTLAALYQPLSNAASWLYMSQGRGRDLLLTASIGAAVMFASFLGGLPFGPTGVAIGYSLSGILIQLPLTFCIAGRRGPVRTRDLFGTLLANAPICAAVLAVTAMTATTMQARPPIIQLLACGGAGASMGAFAILAIPRTRRTVFDLINAVREYASE
jgi:O-antigen/teichoic acid export membrane protein